MPEVSSQYLHPFYFPFPFAGPYAYAVEDTSGNQVSPGVPRSVHSILLLRELHCRDVGISVSTYKKGIVSTASANFFSPGITNDSYLSRDIKISGDRPMWFLSKYPETMVP